MTTLSETECSIEGCHKPAHCRGWCDMHYCRWKRHGATDPRRSTYEERFWAKVDKSADCWEWTAAKSEGYGSVYADATGDTRAHRVAWRMCRGEIPDDLHVLHHCDNRACVNPDHLYLGTHADNMLDKMERGQSKIVPRGRNHYAVKLTPADVREIRKLLDKGLSHKAIAKQFPVTEGAIYGIAIGRNWKHVT